MRNTCVTTVAPTGTIGMLAEASGGLEPNFAISFIKNVMDGTELVYTNKYFEEIAQKAGFFSKELMREIAKVGSIQDFEEIPKEIRDVFVTAQDIAPEWHIRMQAAFQKFVDSSVSKTINFPTDAQINDIEDAYKLAYKLGCKGVTIYRDKSREAQVLNIGKVNKKKEEITSTHTNTAKPAYTPEPKKIEEIPYEEVDTTENQEPRAHGRVESNAQEVTLPFVNDDGIGTVENDETSSQSQISSEYSNPMVEEFTLPPIQPQRESRSVGAASVMTQEKLLTKKEIMEGKICPECHTSLQIAEGCMLCLGCGFSACSV